MKHFFIVLVFLSTQASASLGDCMKDASDYGYKVEKKPDQTCYDLIKNHPQKAEARGQTGRYQAFGKGSIVYIETVSLDGTNTLIRRDTLAGDQTDLKNVSRIWIHEKRNRLLVLQAGSPRGLQTYPLGPVGNTAPMRHFISPILNSVDRVKLLDDKDEIALISLANQSIKFINSDADNVRYKGGIFVPKLLREIKGDLSQLSNPLDVALSEIRKEIYVLDSARVLIYGLPLSAGNRPKVIIKLPAEVKQAEALEVGTDEGFISLTLKTGKTAKVSIKH